MGFGVVGVEVSLIGSPFCSTELTDCINYLPE